VIDRAESHRNSWHRKPQSWWHNNSWREQLKIVARSYLLFLMGFILTSLLISAIDNQCQESNKTTLFLFIGFPYVVAIASVELLRTHSNATAFAW